MSEFSRETLASTPCIRPLHAGQDDQACRALHPGADCRALAGGRLPSGPTLFVWRALRDGLQSTSCSACGHIGRFLVTEAGVLCTPERGQQLGAQASTWQHIQGGIDALVRESRPYVVRLRVSETPGNLFGRTSLVQVGADIGPEPRVQEFTGAPWLTRPGRCQALRHAGAIRNPTCIAHVFAADRAGCAPQHPGDHSQRKALGPAHTQSLTFFGTHVRIAMFGHGNTLAHRGW